MAQVVLVHGIGQQFEGSRTLCGRWERAVRDGLERAGYVTPDEVSVACAFYGDAFRPSGKSGAQLPPYGPGDVDHGFEEALLLAWWEEAARAEPDRVHNPHEQTKLATPQLAQRALKALSKSRFFAGVAQRVLIFNAKQVRRYFDEPDIRQLARQRVADQVSADTRVLVGHSLGSIVAYEALCAHPMWPVQALVTLGSPLGITSLIFDRLDPFPANGVGRWPGGVTSWANVSDRGDIVALVKELAPCFSGPVVDYVISNGARAHDSSRYLTAMETGRGIAAGL